MGARSALGLAVAAVARWNRVPVRAGLGVPEERANALVQLRADDVFEFAGLRVRLGIVNGKSVLEESLGEAVTAENGSPAAGSPAAYVDFPLLALPPGTHAI